MMVHSSLVVVLALVSACSGGYLYRRPAAPLIYPQHPLTVLAEAPYSVDPRLSAVPLVLVANNDLRVLSGGRITSFAPDRPMVTLQPPSLSSGVEAMPAVRVVLPRPLLVDALQTTIPFPSGFTVVHEGLRMPINVGALLAPVAAGTYVAHARPVAIHVVYAIPAEPIRVAYPFYQPLPPPTRPIPSSTVGTPLSGNAVAPVSVSRPPPASVSRPSPAGQPDSRPLVTVLDFPSAVASPGVLFFQPPTLDSEELGNREPPQAVAPAGIVQSTQPQPNLSVFVNSKESPILQVLRDEAEQQRQKNKQTVDDVVQAL